MGSATRSTGGQVPSVMPFFALSQNSQNKFLRKVFVLVLDYFLLWFSLMGNRARLSPSNETRRTFPSTRGNGSIEGGEEGPHHV